MKPVWGVLWRAVAAGALVAACSNAGADRVLTVPGAGQVRGFIYLDRNGDTTFGGAPDVALTQAKVKLIALGTVDTVGRATSDTGVIFAGTPVNFSFLGVPVGSYRVAVDTLTIPHDSMRIVQIDSTVSISPSETSFVRVTVSFPTATAAAIRVLPLKTKVFLVGVALANANSLTDVLGDTVNTLADATGAILLTHPKATTIIAFGDSDRVLGTVDTLLGQRVFRFVSLTPLDVGQGLPQTILTVGQAKTANGGAADAALVSVQAPGRVVILDTSSGPAGRILHVTDTTGAKIDTLEVHLDSLAGFFTDTTIAKRDTVGGRVRLKGILLPSTVPGRWILKPRSPADQT